MSSAYKRYLVLEPEVFEKLQSSSVSEHHLDANEKEMLKILKSKEKTPQQRMQRYRQLLFRNLNTRMSNKEKIKAPLKKDAETSIDYDARKESGPKKQPKVHTVSSLDDEFDAIEVQKASTPKKQAKDHATSTFEEVFEGDGEQPTIIPRIFNESEADLMDFDVSKEQNDFIDEIRRNSAGPVDINKLSFRGLDNPERRYVVVENGETGDVLSVEKSDAVMDRLKRMKKSTMSRYEVDLLSPSKLSPRKTRKSNKKRSPNKNKTPIKNSWYSFEDFNKS